MTAVCGGEGEHLRRLMPNAHPWTIDITAQILVSRGLDTDGKMERVGAGDRRWPPAGHR